MKKYISFLFVSLLALSCSQEEMIDPSESFEQYNTSIVAVMEGDDDTKSQVGAEGNFTWAAGDRISVWTENGTSGSFSTFTLSEDSDGRKEGKFNGTLAEGAQVKGYAIYPASENHTCNADGTLTLHLPSEYGDFDTDYSPNTHALMIAKADEAGSETQSITFRHLAGVLRLTLKNVPAGAAQVVFTANTGITGDFKVDPKTEAPVVNTVEKTETNNTVTIKFKPLAYANISEMQFFFPLPVGEYAGFTVALQDKDGNELWLKSVTKTNKIVRKTLSSLPSFSIISDEVATQLQKEREALIALYNALDGDNWTKKTNWCSDSPVGEWAGITTDNEGFVRTVNIWEDSREFYGKIPEEIYNLMFLTDLSLYFQGDVQWEITPEISNYSSLKSLKAYGLIGDISDELFSLKELTEMTLFANQRGDGVCNIDMKGIGQLDHLIRLHLNGIYISSFEDICNLRNLEFLTIDRGLRSSTESLTLPPSIGNLKKLKNLDISSYNLSGEIPKELGECTNLSWLYLPNNKLSGSIPEELGKLRNLDYIYLQDNMLSGNIPEWLWSAPYWQCVWGNIVMGNNLDIYVNDIEGVDFNVVDIYGDIIDSEIEYKKNTYTVLYKMTYSSDYITEAHRNKMLELYNRYKAKGVEFIGWSRDDVETIKDLNLPWRNFKIGGENSFTDKSNNKYMDYPVLGMDMYAVVIVNQDKQVVYSDLVNTESVETFFAKELDGAGSDLYESTDYSHDGEVTQLKAATVGNGIDIVLMGDAYSDRLIADGTYNAVMRNTLDELFTVEPYKSYKDCFNVYQVDVVSANEVYDEYSTTALGTWFGEGTLVGGDDNKAITYAQKAISADRMNEAMIVVMMNKDAYAGTCYMYYPDSGDYGNGLSVSYIPTSSDAETFAGLIHHETCGHGFAKLDDEYAYEEYGRIPANEIADYESMEPYGWWKNTDLTNDPAQVKWAHFLSDERYANDGLGVFEGGSTYWTGVWRPTENSIMRYNTGDFNAPSREAIYYRIHKLAYGDSWEYDYEKFVEYDAINRTAATKSGRPNYVEAPKDFVPLAPPVVYRHSWREAMDGQKSSR